jgi:predicted RNA-binding Zn-ribbon protein involved in translation (DUF1610 family)
MTSPDQERLSACPFCGGEAEIERKGTARASMIVACTDCGARVESGDVYGLTHPERYAWNRRAQAPTPEAGGFVEAGWIITYSDGSAAFAFTDEEAEDAIAEASPGATKAPVFFASRPTPADERGAPNPPAIGEGV